MSTRRPTHLHATQNATFDPDPLADQLTLRKHFETLQDPAKRVGVVGVERRDQGGKGAAVLGDLANDVGLRGELTDGALLQSGVAHDAFLP